MMMPVYFGRMGLLIVNVVMESEVRTIMYFQCGQKAKENKCSCGHVYSP